MAVVQEIKVTSLEDGKNKLQDWMVEYKGLDKELKILENNQRVQNSG